MPNAGDYQHMQAQLLPPGPAFDADKDDTLPDLQLGFADELDRFDTLAAGLLTTESDPAATTLLLGEWERMAGLPDTCTGAIADTAGRRLALAQKISAQGGQSRSHFIGLAAALGFTATISETPASFSWVLNVSVDAGLIPRAALECIINRTKPGHTTVTFSYP